MWTTIPLPRILGSTRHYAALGLLMLAPYAHTQATPTLEDQLQSMYKTSVVDADGTVASPGTLLMLVHGGLTTAPLHGTGMVCAQTFHDGKLDPAGRMCRMGQGRISLGVPASTPSPMLADGAAVQITRISVERSKDLVRFDLIDSPLDAQGNVAPSTRKAAVNFQFPKGYLANADAGQVADLVSQELQAPNNATAGAQAGPAQPAAVSGPGPAAPPPPPKSVQVGMTQAQVTDVLGQPTTTATAGNKTIWMCQGLKITFQNGHVTDIQ